jgi:hypothetical protein
MKYNFFDVLLKPSWKTHFTTVTPFSKILALFIFITFPFLGFYLGYQIPHSVPVPDPVISSKPITQNYHLQKSPSNKTDPFGGKNYQYDLIKTDVFGKNIIVYSLTNWNGFSYQVSDDGKFIAIINNSMAMGDETITLINSNGQVLKEFGHLDSPQALIPLLWTDHSYWLSMGIPIGEPIGTIRIDADTLKEYKYFAK